MNDPALRSAYAAFWVPQYAAKVAAILDRLTAEGHVALPARPRVLDVGAGPLSAALGAWLHRGALASPSTCRARRCRAGARCSRASTPALR
jgi:hypothetical protein